MSHVHWDPFCQSAENVSFDTIPIAAGKLDCRRLRVGSDLIAEHVGAVIFLGVYVCVIVILLIYWNINVIHSVFMRCLHSQLLIICTAVCYLSNLIVTPFFWLHTRSISPSFSHSLSFAPLFLSPSHSLSPGLSYSSIVSIFLSECMSDYLSYLCMPMDLYIYI